MTEMYNLKMHEMYQINIYSHFKINNQKSCAESGR